MLRSWCDECSNPLRQRASVFCRGSFRGHRVAVPFELLLQLGESECPEHDNGWTSRDRMFDPQSRWKGAAVLAERSDRALCKDPGEAKYRKPQLGLFQGQLRQRPRYVDQTIDFPMREPPVSEKDKATSGAMRGGPASRQRTSPERSRRPCRPHEARLRRSRDRR